MKKQKEYREILFDLDGTLTDPKLGITKSVQYSLASFGIDEECLDNLECFIGPPLKDSFCEFYNFDSERAEEAIKKYREYFSTKGLYENQVYEHIPELLEALVLEGKKLIVATSKPTVFSEQILEYFDLKKYFTLVVGSNLDGSRVKKGEVIKFALEQLNLKDHSSAVMIGDRKHDVIGAKEAGIDSIGVTYGYGSPEEIKAIEPTYIAHIVEDIKQIIL